ncbi:DMT family transporter [Sphingobacterium sp. HJSM2_6]|uniref:DMT family transporter n=1 Tax=Sphingobacterium sp. HJSM2_6 TaxID=3366264 RepID=UPI003BEBF93B
MDRSKENELQGWINGFIGVVIFSGSLPATKVAVLELEPIFISVFRASVAGFLALFAVILLKVERPSKNQLGSLLIIVCAVIIGFPLLSALALQYISSAHSILYIGVLPIAATVFGILRGADAPKPIFWLFSSLGAVLVIAYAVFYGESSSLKGDFLMFLSVLVCGLGYAEGTKLTKQMGGWQVISWALILALPVMLVCTYNYFPLNFKHISINAGISLGYVSIFSMFIGFIFWYKGLAQGGIAFVGQLQLLQPFFGLILSALLLQEKVNSSMIFVIIGVILCVMGTKKFAK